VSRDKHWAMMRRIQRSFEDFKRLESRRRKRMNMRMQK